MDTLHYTNAVIYESFRFTGFVYNALPHFTTADVDVPNTDYIIPKDTAVLVDLFHIMNDPDYWEEPRNFKPERFLDSEGKFQTNERVVPFSIGKRYCLGQSLAEKEFFLFYVSIMQKFELEPFEELPTLDIENYSPKSILRPCPNYVTVFKLRN